jgi:hypothetical protein
MTDLKLYVIEELVRIVKECPDYRLKLQALDLLYKISEDLKEKNT